MSYSTQADLEAAIDQQTLIGLTDDEMTGAVNATRLLRAISDADGLIDGYLRGRYSVPLQTVPPLVRRLSVVLAIQGLFDRRAHVMGGIPEWVKDRMKIAMDELKALRKGELDLGVEPPPAKSAAIAAEVQGPARQFTEETLKDF